MKYPLSLLFLLGVLGLVGCEGYYDPKIGMSEKTWLLNTIVNRVVYQEGHVTAYRSNGTYYYFLNGVLVRMDPQIIAASKIVAEAGGTIQPAAAVAPTVTPTVAPTVTPAVTAVSPGNNAPAGTTDIYAELRKLDGLRKDGIITQAEFEAQKKKLLDSK
jgi:hypothetical protein